MKKVLFATIFLLACLSVFSQEAFIEQLTGTVEIKQPRETAFKAAKKGDRIYQETVISTSFKSLAVIKVGGTTITVRPLTHLTLTEVQRTVEAETLQVNVQAGRVRVDVKPPVGMKATTTVRGPIATASVRGTSFEFDTNNVYVSEGSVSFSGNRGQPLLVGAGGSSRVEQTGRATNPREARTLDLMPPSPAGTGAGESAAPGPASAGVNFSITLTFK